jgi:hypothetical protein
MPSLFHKDRGKSKEVGEGKDGKTHHEGVFHRLKGILKGEDEVGIFVISLY